MARGEDNVESYMGKSSSSTSSKDVPSRVDLNGVITWLMPFGEARAITFWRKFSFPLMSRFFFPLSGPHFEHHIDED